MKENNKRIFAGVATLATLAALAMPGAAMAADADGTITIDAGAGNTLAGHSLTAYRLASYTDAKASEDGTTLTSVSGNAVDAATEAWLKSALTASGATIKTGDSAASTLMRLTTSSKTLLTVADKLKDTAATSKVTAVKSNVTATTQSTTLTLPEGYYLIVDSEGVPILVSTTVGQATTMGGATLGRTLVKTNTTKILKEVKASDGSWKHNVAVSNGDTRDFRATFTVPSKLSVDTLTITDIMTGMSLVNGSLTLNTVDSKGAATPITPAADYYTTAVDGSKITITGKHKLMEDYEGKQVRIAYKAKITNASKAAAATNTIQVQQNLVPGITPPTTPPPSDKDTASTYDVRLKKVSAANPSTTLQGAQFRIHNDTADTWYTWTESTKQWSAAASEDKATTFTTDKNGVIDFTNLGMGTGNGRHRSACRGSSGTSSRRIWNRRRRATAGSTPGVGTCLRAWPRMDGRYSMFSSLMAAWSPDGFSFPLHAVRAGHVGAGAGVCVHSAGIFSRKRCSCRHCPKSIRPTPMNQHTIADMKSMTIRAMKFSVTGLFDRDLYCHLLSQPLIIIPRMP